VPETLSDVPNQRYHESLSICCSCECLLLAQSGHDDPAEPFSADMPILLRSKIRNVDLWGCSGGSDSVINSR
jgi:hypothetical protein